MSIFVSYTTRDELIVRNTLEILAKSKIYYWFAPNDICAGEKHTEVIIPAIKNCKLFIVFLSKYSRPYGENNNDISEWVKDEISVARGAKKYIIPIKLDSTVDKPTSDLLFERLGNYIDFDSTSFELGTQQLVNTIKYLLEDDNYLKKEINYIEILKESELKLLDDIANLIKANSIASAEETLKNNHNLRNTNQKHYKLYETIILMSKKILKDLNAYDIDLIIENIKFLKTTDFLHYALYLEALLVEYYFNFNCIRNSKTQNLNLIRELAQRNKKLSVSDFKLLQSIQTLNNKIKLEWMTM